MIALVFRYEVRDPEAFADAYGPEGEWAQFFRQGAGYLGTTLLRDPDKIDHYATIDQWDSADDFLRFKEEFAAEYKQRDAHCNQFTVDERLVGYFETL